MQPLLTIAVAALAAFGARSLALSRSGSDPAHDSEHRLLALRGALEEARAENQRLSTEIARRAGLLVPASAPESGLDEAEIGAALARWRAANPAPTEGERRAATTRATLDAELAAVPIDELVHLLASENFTNQERQELFQRLRDAGRIDEYLAAIEKLAAEDPNNAGLQVALGHAYLQKLFGVGNSPEAGPLAMASDAAFDRALELDETNWSARFSKAVSLSNWPAFLGRAPEAIEHFELLLEQQADVPTRPEFAMTYLFLGNMYQASGAHEKAVATWKAGLGLFPDFADLQHALELAQGSGSR